MNKLSRKDIGHCFNTKTKYYMVNVNALTDYIVEVSPTDIYDGIARYRCKILMQEKELFVQEHLISRSWIKMTWNIPCFSSKEEAFMYYYLTKNDD